MIYFIFYLAAKKRNPLTALQEDEPIPSPAPSSVLQMPFTPGRTPNKNRGMILRNYLFHFQRSSPMHLSRLSPNFVYYPLGMYSSRSRS
jgi:hypothetical protein